MQILLKILLCFAAGLLGAASMPDAGIGKITWNYAPYTFPLFALALYCLYTAIRDHASRKTEAALFAYAWAFGYFLLHLNWIGNALLVDGNPYAWAYPLAVAGLPALLALFWAVGGAIAMPLLHRASTSADPFVFAAVFAITEWTRGHALTGFPWGLSGMFWIDTPLMIQVLSLIGTYGLTLLTMIWALGLMLLATSARKYIMFILLATASAATTFIIGLDRIDTRMISTGTLQTLLVQANIPQSEKWDSDRMMDHFGAHIELSARPEQIKDQPTMIVWPETALPPDLINAPVVRASIAKVLATYPSGSFLVTGALHATGNPRSPEYYNSVFVYDSTGTPYKVYDKHHLVPFGEYIPFQKYIPLEPVARFIGMQSGPGPKTVVLPNMPSFSPLICYEAIFGNAAQPANADYPAQLLANFTNDSWYGDTAGPRQHLALARARSIENGLPMIRAAGTGISAIIDDHGTIISSAPYGRPMRLLATIPVPYPPQTLYHTYGDIPFGVLSLIFLLYAYTRKNK